jgi:hypothetical protein
LERLKDDLGVQKFARWIRKKKVDPVCELRIKEAIWSDQIVTTKSAYRAVTPIA